MKKFRLERLREEELDDVNKRWIKKKSRSKKQYKKVRSNGQEQY